MQDFSAIIRAAITASGKTNYALGKESGVAHQRIAAFMAGTDIRLETAKRLAHALGLTLRRKSA